MNYRKTIENDERFESLENLGVDGLMLYTNTGWCLDDVGCHTRSYDTIKEAAIDGQLEVKPCNCEQCKKETNE